MSNTYEYEYTDTFAGEANSCWVKRGTVTMPELTHYGYDGGTNYCRASRIASRELMKAVKAELGLTGVRGRTLNYGDMIEFRPYGMATALFITSEDSSMTKINLAIPRGAKIGPEAKPIYGYVEVEAIEERGLAVHKSLPGNRGRWTVTHVQSGLRLDCIGAMTKKAAMENMRRALELPIDWTMNEQETIKALREDRRIMDGINAIITHD